jgi:hypothetical protein
VLQASAAGRPPERLRVPRQRVQTARLGGASHVTPCEPDGTFPRLTRHLGEKLPVRSQEERALVALLLYAALALLVLLRVL